MKVISWATLFLAASLVRAASPAFPEGTFDGTAAWRGPTGSSGIYKVERSFTGTTMSSHYTWTQPEAREETAVIRFDMKPSEPVFDVLDGKSRVIGRGYCYDDACAYRATFGPVTVAETIRWAQGTLSVLGSKEGPGFSVVWKEALKSR